MKKIVAFSGGCFSGKTTTLNLVAEALKANGLKVEIFKENIRQYIQHGMSIDSIRSNPSQYLNIELQVIRERIAFEQECLLSDDDNTIVLMDRALTDNLFYLMTYLNIQKLNEQEQIALQTLLRDLVIHTRQAMLFTYLVEFAPINSVCDDKIYRPSAIDNLKYIESTMIGLFNYAFKRPAFPERHIYINLNCTDSAVAVNDIINFINNNAMTTTETTNKLKFCKVKDVKSPERGTLKSAGIDFFIPNDFEQVELLPGEDILIPSGIVAKIPEGFMLMAADKSGVSPSKEALENIGMTVKNENMVGSLIVGAKIVDEDYPGEIHMHVINIGIDSCILSPGDKLVQFILVPVSYAMPEQVDCVEDLSLTKGERTGGFGSTNK